MCVGGRLARQLLPGLSNRGRRDRQTVREMRTPGIRGETDVAKRHAGVGGQEVAVVGRQCVQR